LHSVVEIPMAKKFIIIIIVRFIEWRVQSFRGTGWDKNGYLKNVFKRVLKQHLLSVSKTSAVE